MSQGFWIPKGDDDLNDGEMTYNSTSRMEVKRSHQWFMHGPEADLLPNKKQALEPTSSNSFLELLNSTPSQWGVTSGFPTASGHFSEQLYDPESSRMTNYHERIIPSSGCGKMNMGQKLHEDLLLNDSSFALSMSSGSENPGSSLHYGGTRKVKVSQVDGSEHMMPVSLGHGYNKMESNHLFMPHAMVKNEENPMSLALPSGVGVGDGSIMLGNTTGEDCSGILMRKLHGSEDDSASIEQTYREDDNSLSTSHVIGRECNNIMSTGQGYQSDGCTMSMTHMYNNEGDSSSLSVGNSCDKTENLSHTFGRGQSTIISFGGCDDDSTSGRLIYNYEMLMNQPSLQMSDASGHMGLVKSNDDVHLVVPGAANNSKKKEEQNITKKSPSNNFPSNVRSLLSTGILDGVHVKYIAWSREKELRAIIRGCGYLCGCPSCNYTKVINAYEFERHAGCKTKHPNNHIYFENGKTIYGTVQELRSTPQHMLFEVMQTITGSPINQKSFLLWKGKNRPCLAFVHSSNPSDCALCFCNTDGACI